MACFCKAKSDKCHYQLRRLHQRRYKAETDAEFCELLNSEAPLYFGQGHERSWWIVGSHKYGLGIWW
jgi:hypothetical protein